MPRQGTSIVKRLLQLLAMLGALVSGATPAMDDTALWDGLKSGRHVALMRHAQAPGVGDPAGFRLDDCGTQRNLSAEGRQQAEQAGALLRRMGVNRATVYSSQWCRCLDTARGLGLGPVRPQPALNSFFENGGTEKAQTEQLRGLIRQRPAGAPLVLVTHQVNITALTGLVPASGEIVVLRAEGDQLAVAGRLPAK
jgi:broad specificity phosphatase PhoE